MESIHHGDVTGCNVGNHLRDEEGIELRSDRVLCLGIAQQLLVEGLNTTNTRSKNHTDTVLIYLVQIHRSIGNSLLGCIDGQKTITVALASLLPIHDLQRIEILHFASELCLIE